MNIRRALIGMLSAVVAAALLLGVTFLDVNLTSDVEPDLSYRTLDYDVMVLKNGDLKVTQHIDMKLNDRGFDWKQMYQQYTLKANNLTNISDISVKDVTNNETYIQGRFVNPMMSPIGTLNTQVSGISRMSAYSEIPNRSILKQMV